MHPRKPTYRSKLQTTRPDGTRGQNRGTPEIKVEDCYLPALANGAPTGLSTREISTSFSVYLGY